jgi:hypothetical protein
VSEANRWARYVKTKSSAPAQGAHRGLRRSHKPRTYPDKL